MRLDYWNHPLIVKALRSRYRGGRIFTLASGHLLLLLVGAMIMFYYRSAMPGPWARNYFVAMISVQFLLSALVAASAVSSSMQAEVTTRTLDFQRIAAITPAQILLGKVIGEPASSYLLALASVPMAVLCHALGGVSLAVLVLLYITLGTTTFMVACLAAQHPLDPTAPAKAGAAGTGGIGCVGVLVWFSFMVAMSRRGGAPSSQLLSGIVGLFTPIITITAIPSDAVWAETVSLFGVAIPYIVLTPLAQLGIAAHALSGMVRRLSNPLNTLASKPQAYAWLAVVDLVWAAMVFDSAVPQTGVARPAIFFLIGHTVLAFLLVQLATPRRQTFLSWVWRLRGRRRLGLDLLVGERSLNVLALGVCSLMGLVILGMAVVLPGWMSGAWGPIPWESLGAAALLSVLVLFSYGLLFQACAIAGERGASAFVIGVAAVAMLLPYGLGEYYQEPFLSSLSPIGVCAQILKDRFSPPWFPPILLLHLVAALCWAWLLRGLARALACEVDKKLESMGVRCP